MERARRQSSDKEMTLSSKVYELKLTGCKRVKFADEIKKKSEG